MPDMTERHLDRVVKYSQMREQKIVLALIRIPHHGKQSAHP